MKTEPVSASVRQCVENVGIGSANQASIELAQAALDQDLIRWPSRIRHRSRIPGLGKMATIADRVATPRKRLYYQRIVMEAFAWFVVRKGTLFLERGQESIQVNAGDSVVLMPGEYTVTEIPDDDVISYHRIFFGTRLLRSSWSQAETMATFCPPGIEYLFPQPGYIKRLRGVGIEDPFQDMKKSMRILMNGVYPGFLIFVKRALFVPRSLLDLHMERFVLAGISLQAIAEAYPTGTAGFSKDFNNYHYMTPKGWMRRRRVELAMLWIRFTDNTLDEIATTLGYSEPKEMETDFRKLRRQMPSRIQRKQERPGPDQFAATAVPFWYREIYEWCIRQRVPLLIPAGLQPTNNFSLHECDTVGRLLDSEFLQPGSNGFDAFWGMKSTGFAQIIPFPKPVEKHPSEAAVA